MFGRGSLFPTPFDNDPFFRDPFAQMDNMMRSMFNDPFFAHPHMQPMGFGFGPPQQPMPGQYQQQSQQLPPPVVEEVLDEGETAQTHSHNEPTVEEPDDPPTAHAPRHARHPRQQQQQASSSGSQAALPGFGGFGGNASGFYSYSSSSYSSVGGPNGVTFSTTTTTRAGPGQVRETQRTVHDGRTGQQSITISRGIGDKARTITRTRDGEGREVMEDHLEGLQPGDAPTFDQQWAQQAERSLPTWGASQPTLRLGAHQQQGGHRRRQHQQQPQLALPSSGQQQGGYSASGAGYGYPGQY